MPACPVNQIGRCSVAKSFKTADELQNMILDRAREKSMCPPGMSVHIRRTRSGWGIDCMPPTFSTSRHVDSCDLMMRIASELRSEYDLQA